ncbi:MAG: carboxypeptidase-like regulatory domain-containing protein [Chloroflexota bacterium]|nr:carboxypeptidase-like regulatory domain-containing protein [Chloroflexota bacterium]
MRRLLVPALCCLVAVVCAAGLSVASADDDEPSLPGSVVTTLKPGDNRIGWVAERISAEELFARLPQVALVYAWDADSGRYEIAAPRLPRRYWTIRFLEPGRGYVLRIGGSDAVEWRRSVLPASGLVSLRSGVNWSAWAGRDNASISDVARGIGTSLLSIRSGDLIYDPSVPESMDEWPVVRRGDALEVSVSRDVNWLQPTFVMPEIHYAGNVDHGVRRLIERDLAATLKYSASELGVQADPFSLVVVVAGDAKSAHDKTNELGHPWEWESFRNFWQRAGGWYSSDQDAFYLKSSSWEGSSSGRYHWGRYVVLHEYIHALQFQLMGDNYIDLDWLLEGSANWFDSDLATQDRNGYPLSRRLIDALNRASKGPPLEEIESSNETWQYSFGLVAADLLIDRAGKSAPLDFYRVLAPGRAGPGGRWETWPTMRTAFVAAFGLTIEEFYDEFEVLMAKRRGSAKRRPAANEFALAGTIVNSDGTPRVGASLEAREYRDGHPAGWDRRATSREDGTFEVFVRKRADYVIWIELGDDGANCQFWWLQSSDAAKPSDDQASLIKVGSSQPDPIAIAVDADQCRWRIAGTLSGPDNLPLSGIEVRAQREGSSTLVRTERDGSFTFVATQPGSYQLSADLGGCRLYWSAGDPSWIEEQAGTIEVVNRDIADIRFRAEEDPCVRVMGWFLDAAGDAIANVQINAVADDHRANDRTDSSGRFSIALVEPGAYRLDTWLDGCRLYHGRGGATGIWQERQTVDVTDHDVSGLVFQLQPGMCTLRISGRFLNADGTPRTGIWIGASGESGRGGDWPAEDGTFSFAVPGPGVYDMSVTVDNCEIYYAGNGNTGSKSESRSFNITRSDLTGVEFRLPQDPASVCN